MGFIFITVRTEAYQLKATHRDKKGVPYASFSYMQCLFCEMKRILLIPAYLWHPKLKKSLL